MDSLHEEIQKLLETAERNRREFLRVETETCRIAVEKGCLELSLGNPEEARKEYAIASRGVEVIEHFLGQAREELPEIRGPSRAVEGIARVASTGDRSVCAIASGAPRGGCVGADLLGGLAAGDDGGDGGVAEAPGKRPLAHGDAGRDFGAKALDFGEVAGEASGVEGRAEVAAGEGRAGLVLSGQQAAGQGDAGEHAEVLAEGVGKVQLLRGGGRGGCRPPEGPQRRRRALHRACGSLPREGDGDAEMADFPGRCCAAEHRPEIVVAKGVVGAGVELVEVDGVGAKGSEGSFELARDVGGGVEVFAAAEEAVYSRGRTWWRRSSL